jgi:hypothetical protein
MNWRSDYLAREVRVETRKDAKVICTLPPGASIAEGPHGPFSYIVAHPDYPPVELRIQATADGARGNFFSLSGEPITPGWEKPN